MLEALKHKGFDKLFYRYNSLYLIRRHFRYFGAAGDFKPESADGRPLLYIMNHSSWWDGLLAYHAVRTLTSSEHYFMMEEEQLRKYTFFRKLGAYSIDRSSTRDIQTSLRYTANLLRNGGSVWMYPEGEIRLLEHRPLSLKMGVGVVLRLCPDAAVVPVTLYHGLFRHPKPEAVLLAGEPLIYRWKELEREVISMKLQTALEHQLDQQRQEMIEHGGFIPDRYKPLMKSGKSTHERFDSFFDRWRR
ncbi:lysophospholipid acyltransferase family protein [Paenibacillus sp. sgz500958]|uniref:lysophospholipid acyltransferase family protein n=1 Tax=Paenibacillus sp. sgz500958 TaxID=3242475 RepID=UPI0036D393C2